MNYIKTNLKLCKDKSRHFSLKKNPEQNKVLPREENDNQQKKKLYYLVKNLFVH